MTFLPLAAYSVVCNSCGKDYGGSWPDRAEANRVVRRARWLIKGLVKHTCPTCRIKAGMRCQFNEWRYDMVGKSCLNEATKLHRGPFGMMGPFLCGPHDAIVHRSDTDNMVG